MTDDIVKNISERYIELYENITGEHFVKESVENLTERIENNIKKYLETV
jgi:phosphoribosylaminoimidazole-succinocarboxamide synthase